MRMCLWVFFSEISNEHKNQDRVLRAVNVAMATESDGDPVPIGRGGCQRENLRCEG